MVKEVRLLLRNTNGLIKFLQWLDTGTYQLWQQFKGLSKRQKQFLICLVIVCVFVLLSFISTHTANNAMWVEGTWSNHSEKYSIKAKNKKCKFWNVKQNGYILMEDAQVAANSTKRNIVLAKSGSNTEYHIIKLDNEHLELQIFNNKKMIKTMELQKSE